MREKLIELLNQYFAIGDSYSYNLTRVKSAFAIGTVGLEDFEEFDEETTYDLADYLIANGVTIAPASLRPKGEWIYNTDDFTPKKRCTNCGYNKPLVAGEALKQEPDNFCPNCGADMRGETQ